ncbi:resuscitation-promoting factor [Streptomyces albofaciens JCM 4342]|uniref:resuscitation-promoting factor n=1 Tax=Streptomyces albofaciens TaxID=66866 RepID=UPI00123B72FE|nr:resuscitation-promoting factor [Streptomyces albofaciens]KAA6221395.1 resuscitation-promoting factor [Streptomyces albofaciens JCM 4342]
MTHSQGSQSHRVAHGGYGPGAEPRGGAVEAPDPYGRYAPYGEYGEFGESDAYGGYGSHGVYGAYGTYAAYGQSGPYDVYEAYEAYGAGAYERYERYDAAQPQEAPGGSAESGGPAESGGGAAEAGGDRLEPAAQAEPSGRVPHQGPLVPLRDDLAGVPTPGLPAHQGRAAARRAARGTAHRRGMADRLGTVDRRGIDGTETRRRLLPQALVVAFLAGGTAAFIAHDKAVRIDVDGEPRTLHTFASDVGDLLADEDVRVGEHDSVQPAADAELASGDEVVIRYGRPVRLTLDGQHRDVWTTAETVGGALRQFGVRAEGAHLSVDPDRRIGRNGLDLDVRTERSVTFVADGREHTVRTNAATVREALDQAGIALRGEDTTSVAPDSFPRDGQTISVLRITGAEKVREETIAFRTVKKADPTLFKGTETVVRQGQPGVRRLTYEVRTVNGVQQKPKKVGSEVVREPRDRIVHVGTKPVPQRVAGADHLNWDALAQCEAGGRPDAVDASGTYGGLYQFDTGTWQGLGGKGRPQDAPAGEQTYRAKKLYISRGASPWPVCGRRLHG